MANRKPETAPSMHNSNLLGEQCESVVNALHQMRQLMILQAKSIKGEQDGKEKRAKKEKVKRAEETSFRWGRISDSSSHLLGCIVAPSLPSHDDSCLTRCRRCPIESRAFSRAVAPSALRANETQRTAAAARATLLPGS